MLPTISGATLIVTEKTLLLKNIAKTITGFTQTVRNKIP